MSVKICPTCNKRYVVDNNISDYVHVCNSGNLAIDQEDIVVTGNWEEGDGSTGKKGAQEVMRQGAENKLFGKRADIEGIRQQDLTPRGKRKSTHRQRQVDTYINFTGEGLD
jgi:hypothetical protein